jgi:hypothetical protein
MTTVLDRTDALAERLFGAALGALELYSLYLGTELGLYRVLERHGPLVSRELAERAGIAPRYAREWLEQQAVAGLIEVEDAGAPSEERLYALAADHARVLLEGDDAARSTIAMAQEFLHAQVDGLDLDAASIADARRIAEHAGLNGRLRFLEGDAAGLARHGPHDL